MGIRQTHTYALLEVSEACWNEIATKLREADYRHAFGDDGEIDMHGIALVQPPPREQKEPKWVMETDAAGVPIGRRPEWRRS